MKLSEKKIEEEKKKSLTYSIKEGGAASVMEGAGNSYISPFAIALNASNSQVGMLASIPSILSPLAQLITAKFVRKIKSRRDLIGLFVLIQALLWIPIILLPFIIKTNQVTYLIILF